MNELKAKLEKILINAICFKEGEMSCVLQLI